jgi:hypothetical protein
MIGNCLKGSLKLNQVENPFLEFQTKDGRRKGYSTAFFEDLRIGEIKKLAGDGNCLKERNYTSAIRNTINQIKYHESDIVDKHKGRIM